MATIRFRLRSLFFRNSTHVTLLTPKGEKPEEALPISVLLSDGATIDLPFTFKYRPDPIVTKIYPTDTIRRY